MSANNGSENELELGKRVAELSIAIDNVKKNLVENNAAEQDRINAIDQLTNLSSSLFEIAGEISQNESERNKLLTLSEIGGKINSHLGTEEVLNQVMDSIIEITGAERSLLMLLDDESKLQMRVGRNWSHKSESKDAMISRTVAQRVAQSGIAVLTSNASEDPAFSSKHSVLTQSLRSILCVPLIIKEKVIGVIYVDSRIHAGLFTEEDLHLLTSFADQAALALDNANLVEGLRQSNQNLEAAYETTLEGWAMALEMRDNETQGHTIRVTELTVHLATYMGISSEELKQIQRGATLHDIGKMGIPDSILLKPDFLTEEERKTMQNHPNYAREMLEQIPFLRPALDIPLYHHERWNGTGYPEGLQGEDIPLPARIFAVVDVWDACVSDRPYREAMPGKVVLAMIQEESGKHFDPAIVKNFTALIGDTKGITL